MTRSESRAADFAARRHDPLMRRVVRVRETNGTVDGWMSPAASSLRLVACAAALLVVGGASFAFVASATPSHSKVEPLLGHRWRVVHVAHANDYSFSVGRSFESTLHFGSDLVLDAGGVSFGVRVSITPVDAGYQSGNSAGVEQSGPASRKAREVKRAVLHVAEPRDVTQVEKISAHRFRLTSGDFKLVCVLTNAKPSPSPHASSPTA